MHIFTCAYGDDVLRGARRADGLRSRTRIAGREDDYHLLIAGGRERRARRLGVSHERVVLLGINIVVSSSITTPTVVADACAVIVRPGLQIRVIWTGKLIRVEDDGRTHVYKWTNPEAIMEANRIRMGKTINLIVKSGNDMRIEISMAIATLTRAAAVGHGNLNSHIIAGFNDQVNGFP